MKKIKGQERLATKFAGVAILLRLVLSMVAIICATIVIMSGVEMIWKVAMFILAIFVALDL